MAVFISSWQNLEHNFFITDIMLEMELEFFENGLKNLEN